MNQPIRVGGPGADPPTLTLTTQATRATAGTTVVLVASCVGIRGTFDFSWQVVGPVRLSDEQAEQALLGATTVTGQRLEINEDREFLASLNTAPLAPGTWTVSLRLDEVPGVGAQRAAVRDPDFVDSAEPILVQPAPLAAGDNLSVSLRPSTIPPTVDQALWVSIRTSTEGLSFNRYIDFMDQVVRESGLWAGGRGRARRNDPVGQVRRAERRAALPFANVDAYRFLLAATGVFMMINVRTNRDNFSRVDLVDESNRLGQDLRPGELEQQFRNYLEATPDGSGGTLDVLPYLDLVRRKLGDVPIVDGGNDSSLVVYGILAEKLTHPVFIELSYDYWMQRGGLRRAMDAIDRRFQNRPPRRPGPDPLATLSIDPLRPLSDLLWAYGLDRQHRLPPARFDDECQQQYGLSLGGPGRRVSEARTRFMPALHNLLAECQVFFQEDDNMVVKANAFDVLNGLKECHLLLTEGAQNSYGGITWMARLETLVNQYLLGTPEMLEFLRPRIMQDTPERWIDAVDVMNRLQGWSDVPMLHYRDLATYSEQLLLSIRYGDWTAVIDDDRAGKWARYYRREIKQYCHAYRAVTGHDIKRRTQDGNGYPGPGQQALRQLGAGSTPNGYAGRPTYHAYRG